MLEIRLLGQFEVQLDGRRVEIPTRAAQSLLAYLALSAGATHRREKLAALFWPGATDSSARNNLRQAVWRIRTALEPHKSGQGRFILADEYTVAFDAASNYQLDVARLERKLAEHATEAEWLEAVSAYQGELLPGFYEAWVDLERERLQGVFERKMQGLIDRLVEARKWPAILEWNERWVALGNVPEPAYRALMMAHFQLGDVSNVTAVYQRCVRALNNDLGVAPSEQTQNLYKRLSKGTVGPGLESSPPDGGPSSAADSPASPPSPLHKHTPRAAPPLPLEHVTRPPIPLTSFIGRAHELEELQALVSAGRFVTLTGAGGTGKTRLAIQAVARLAEAFADGVVWVGLAPLVDPALVPLAAIKALGVHEAIHQPLPDVLVNTLQDRQLLLVLDSCEHLIEACTQLAERLLSTCANVKILATSREAFGLTGETVYHVPTLSLPEAGQELPAQMLAYESARLFVERARAVKSDFALTSQNGPVVAQICRRLDGIPLAIELAAARINVLSAAEIAGRLDDRFNLLTSHNRAVLGRHQTLRAAIDWSFSLLTDPEQILVRRLAVFVGGFSVTMAAAVCAGEGLEPAQILDVVSRLVDKSLVIADYHNPDEVRFRFLETIRVYAQERLLDSGEARLIRDRHMQSMLQLAETAEPKLYGPDAAIWFRRLAAEVDNFRAAMDWSLESDEGNTVLRIVGTHRYLWFISGSFTERMERLRLILSQPKARPPSVARAKALTAFGWLYWGNPVIVQLQPLLEEALAIGTTLGDQHCIAQAQSLLGLVRMYQGDYAAARLLLEQGLELGRGLGAKGRQVVQWALTSLGETALLQGHITEAQAPLEQATAMCRANHDNDLLSLSVRRLGLLAGHKGNYQLARSLFRESLELNIDLADRRGLLACLAAFGGLALAQQDLVRAAALLASVESCLRTSGIALPPGDSIGYERSVACLRSQMEPEALDQAWAAGQALTLEQAIKSVL